VIVEVQPQGELVQSEAGAHAEQHRDDLVPGRGRRDRDAHVSHDQQQEDSPDQVVDVGAPDLDVPRPPAHLSLDHVGAGADEAERHQERDEEQELGLPTGVDDRPVVHAADAGENRDEHEQQGSAGAGRGR
jgi:hypothetical protein